MNSRANESPELRYQPRENSPWDDIEIVPEAITSQKAPFVEMCGSDYLSASDWDLAA